MTKDHDDSADSDSDGTDSDGTDSDATDDDAAEDAEARDSEDADAEDAEATEDAGGTDLDVDDLDSREWRDQGPYDVTEVDLEAEAETGPRIDLGSMIITGLEGAELRLQVADETQQIVSAMLISKDSALELGAFAAPRSGGLWSELREELIEAAGAAGGSAAVVEGPFGVELRRLLPVQTPDGEQGYQPSRMWVAEGPRWLLRGIVYGQAALVDGLESPVAELLDCFRSTVVRRGDEARAPGDLLPLTLPRTESVQQPGDEGSGEVEGAG
ncbi:DUF3710 domain-containing protein [Microlunatus parietis]|uniref:DUF3710 domain-containing protein n=1 Tax=Microlunatus parietis TaxID=682979 RepID=A0A7Y9LG08_9ACTN|nr:DUF3710 domain-containing protein [Microlunatus parietis]NYE75540.1 hypothetical protein [Microlunatus parietis]